MTDQPKPGPLAEGDVKLLRRGDVLLGPDGRLHLFDECCAGGFLTFLDNAADGYLATICTFIGRPDADGWMLWPGGKNPVPGVKVDVRFADGEQIDGKMSDSWGEWWVAADDPSDTIIEFRIPSLTAAAGEVGRSLDEIISSIKSLSITPAPARKNDLEPVAWTYERALHQYKDGTYGDWQLTSVSFDLPDIQKGALRNIQPLYGPEAKARIEALEEALSAAQNADAEANAFIRAQRDAAVKALEYYAGPHERPSEGPWGALSDDYGQRAAKALSAIKGEAQ